MGELHRIPKGKTERRDRLKRMAIRFGLPVSTAKAMRTSDITLWLRCNAPRGEPLEQISRRLTTGRLVKRSKDREQDVCIGPNGPRGGQASSIPTQIIAPARPLPDVFVIRRPDEETLAFWRMTADDSHEYASRIARFSRALAENQ